MQLFFYTSGSTGYPKGVLSTHRNILATLFSWALVTTLKREVEAAEAASESSPEIQQSDVPVNQSAILHCVPLFHVTGSHSGFLMSVIAGRKMVMMTKWDPWSCLKINSRRENWCHNRCPHSNLGFINSSRQR